MGNAMVNTRRISEKTMLREVDTFIQMQLEDDSKKLSDAINANDREAMKYWKSRVMCLIDIKGDFILLNHISRWSLSKRKVLDMAWTNLGNHTQAYNDMVNGPGASEELINRVQEQ